MLKITSDFVRHWAKKYDDQYVDGSDSIEEKAFRSWIEQQGEPKYLNKEYFIRVGRWKSKRQTKNYKSNDAVLIEESTRSACQVANERFKFQILMSLRGVGAPVASTILHFLDPGHFAIFDIRVRTSLKKAGLWNRDQNDASVDACLEYMRIMRELSKKLGVSLRELDKALWAYDKLGEGG